MQTYILSIAGVVLLSAVVTIVAPNGKMGKFVKGMSKLFILAVLVAPLASFAETGKFTLETAHIGEDSGYLRECASILEEEDEAEIAGYLFETFGVTAQVDVTRGTEANFPRQKIAVTLTEHGIIGEDERIYRMTQMKEALVGRYGCETEVV